ncbi:MAG: hypothetical protein BIP78_0625 [Candidatus Bipolaricaulis sibiricus]|uniref:Uncharacterized protein n=1 Tax=Bipolaricaulis sibiricus TaxID=2501609 RepID=A0A410FTW0_BIPS1|nr:MAG: hypothetical protein BIP78_0625 [Candidatus Bipolaricaulis sibiricus]
MTRERRLSGLQGTDHELRATGSRRAFRVSSVAVPMGPAAGEQGG